MAYVIDPHAVRIPRASGLLPCLYVPIAARDENAIQTYIGRIIEPLAHLHRAVLVESYAPEARDERLGIWSIPEAAVLHHPRQVWVHVDLRAYRRAYV